MAIWRRSASSATPDVSTPSVQGGRAGGRVGGGGWDMWEQSGGRAGGMGPHAAAASRRACGACADGAHRC